MGRLASIDSRIYSRREVFNALRDVVKITEREISYWTDLGIVIPDIANPRSQGKTRFYSFLNVIDFAFVKTLSQGSLRLAFIKSAMDLLRSNIESRSNFYDGTFRYLFISTGQNTGSMKIKFAKDWPDGKSKDAFVEHQKEIMLTIADNDDIVIGLNSTSIVSIVQKMMDRQQ